MLQLVEILFIYSSGVAKLQPYVAEHFVSNLNAYKFSDNFVTLLSNRINKRKLEKVAIITMYCHLKPSEALAFPT